MTRIFNIGIEWQYNFIVATVVLIKSGNFMVWLVPGSFIQWPTTFTPSPRFSTPEEGDPGMGDEKGYLLNF